MNERIVSVDVAKGIGIILIVLGHIIANSPCGQYSLLYSVIYFFHVPLFFILAGVFANKEERICDTVVRKFIRLYVPFLIANVCGMLIHIIVSHGYGDIISPPMEIKRLFLILMGADTADYVGPTWFLSVLFRIMIIWKLATKLSNKSDEIVMLVSFVSLFVGFIVPNIFFIPQTLVCLFFFSVGFYFRNFIVGWSFSNRLSLSFFIIGISCLIVLALLEVKIDFLQCKWANPLLLVFASLVGSFSIVSLSYSISKMAVLKNVLSYIGRNTIIILVLHLLVYSLVLKSPIKAIDNQPILIILCLVVCICVPIAISAGLTRVKFFRRNVC